MKFAQLVILILAFLIIQPASAGLLIEPVVGYNMGSFETEDSATINFSEEDFTGPSYGGRLGYQNFGFQIGLDYLNSTLSVDDNDFDDLKTSEWAGFVGFEFPILLRVYAGYIFSATGETEFDGDKVELSGGTGTKFGVGFTVLPFLDINFEYRRGSFDEYKLAGDKVEDGTSYNAYMVGVSLPFVL